MRLTLLAVPLARHAPGVGSRFSPRTTREAVLADAVEQASTAIYELRSSIAGPASARHRQ